MTSLLSSRHTSAGKVGTSETVAALSMKSHESGLRSWAP